MPSCRKLFAQDVRLAADRLDCTAGIKSAVSTPMMPMTTSSSISEKPTRDPLDDTVAMVVTLRSMVTDQ